MAASTLLSCLLLLPAAAFATKCAMFQADNYYAQNVEESYIEAGAFDMGENGDISVDFLPDTLNYNGVLFAMGNKGFTYNPAWMDDANTKAMQFLVIEVLYGAISVVLKMMGTKHPKELEIYRTYPVVYAVDDGQWHHVELIRNGHNWTVEIDHRASVWGVVTNNTHNLLLFAKEGYIGGRPDYTNLQYKGLIKNLIVNGRAASLDGRPQHGLTQIRNCNSRVVRQYIEEIRGQLWNEHSQPYPGYEGNRGSSRGRGSLGSRGRNPGGNRGNDVELEDDEVGKWESEVDKSYGYVSAWDN